MYIETPCKFEACRAFTTTKDIDKSQQNTYNIDMRYCITIFVKEE